MTSPTPDLYALLSLDRSASTAELARVIADRDLELDQQLLPDTDPRRRQLHTAFAVLAEERNRATYDEALASARSLDWSDLEYLGNFGSFPDPVFRPQPQPQAAPPLQSNPYNYPTYSPETPAPGPVSNPFGHASAYTSPTPAPLPGYQADRPSAGLRLGMMLLDGLTFSMVSGLLLWGANSENVLSGILVGLVGVAWFLGFEVLTGASPVKHLFGYEVRDSTTGEKLSWEQSAKRQWWRLVSVVPGIGWLVSFIGMIAIGTSIKPENGLIGSHDRWAGAEVARKSGR